MRCIYQGCNDLAIYIYFGYSVCGEHCNPSSYIEIHFGLINTVVGSNQETVGYLLTKVGFDSALLMQEEKLKELSNNSEKIQGFRNKR